MHIQDLFGFRAGGRFPTLVFARCLCFRNALALALKHDAAFELGHAPKNSQDQLPGWPGCIDPKPQYSEVRRLGRKVIQYLHEVADGASKSVWVRGLTSTPLAYYSDTDLVLSADGADFVDGEVRIAVHLAQLSLPSL